MRDRTPEGRKVRRSRPGSLTASALVITLLLVAAGQPAHGHNATGAAGRPFGLGVSIGSPTGISAKLFAGGIHAFQLDAGWWLADKASVRLAFDYQIHFRPLYSSYLGRLYCYTGPGVRLRLGDLGEDRFEVAVGAAWPVGFVFNYEKLPVDVGLQAGLVVFLYPGTRLDLDGGIRLRYYF